MSDMKDKIINQRIDCLMGNFILAVLRNVILRKHNYNSNLSIYNKMSQDMTILSVVCGYSSLMLDQSSQYFSAMEEEAAFNTEGQESKIGDLSDFNFFSLAILFGNFFCLTKKLLTLQFVINAPCQHSLKSSTL